MFILCEPPATHSNFYIYFMWKTGHIWGLCNTSCVSSYSISLGNCNSSSYEDDTAYLRSKGPTPLGLFMMLLSRLARSLKPLLQWKSCHDDTCCWNICQHCVNFVRNRWAAFQSSSVFLSWNNTNSYVIFPLSIFQKCVVLSKKDT